MDYSHGNRRAGRKLAALCLTLFVVIAAASAVVYSRHSAQFGATSQAGQSAVSAARAYVDPDTGALVAPTQKQLQQLVSTTEDTVATTLQQVAQVVHRNGMTIVRLPRQKRSHLRVEEGAQNHLQHSDDDASDRR